MQVSVVTAVLNRARTIRDAVESVAGQTYAPIEHVVQDGGSSDGTLEILNDCLSPTARLESVRDAGIYDALNRAIARSRGDVIGLLHSDDVFADERVVADIAARFADPEIDAVYGDLQYVSETDPGRVIRHWRSQPFSPDLLRRGWMPPHPTLFLRRSVIDRFGAYDTRYRIAADYDAILRYFGKGAIRASYLPRVLVRMRLGGESNRSLSRIIRKSMEDYKALRANGVGGIGTLALKNVSKLGQFIDQTGRKESR